MFGDVPATGNAGEVSFFIDLERCRLMGRSPEQMVFARRCPVCQARLVGVSKLPPAERQIRDTAKCCSRKDGFVSTEMPLLEIVFRTLLARGNQPIGLRELHYQVTEQWATPSNPKSVSAEALRAIIARDRYYSFGELPQETDKAG